MSGLGRFLEATALVLAFSVVCVIFLEAALGAAAFLLAVAFKAAFGAAVALAFGLDFYGATHQIVSCHAHARVYEISLTAGGSGEKPSESSPLLKTDSANESSII